MPSREEIAIDVSPIGTNLGVGATGGITLDAGLVPQRAGAAWIDEQIAGLPVWVITPSAVGSRIVLTASQLDAGVRTNSVSWLDVDSASLVRTPVNTVHFPTARPVAQAMFADRALIFDGSSGQPMSTTVVWLNKGSGT